MQKIFTFILIAFAILISCAPDAPVAVKQGEHACEHCNMKIADLRFDAQLQTKKGRIKYFDSVECLVVYTTEHSEALRGAWVSDFYHRDKWIPVDQAYYLHSEKRPSPMGASLSAYQSSDDINRAQAEVGGKSLNSVEVNKYVNDEWKSEFPGSEGAERHSEICRAPVVIR